MYSIIALKLLTARQLQDLAGHIISFCSLITCLIYGNRFTCAISSPKPLAFAA